MPSDLTKFLTGFQRGRPLRGAGSSIGQAIYTRGQEKRERERQEQERQQREMVARKYGLSSPIKDAYISGEITLTQALNQIPEPEKPTAPSELLKQEGARKQLRVGGMMERVLPGLIGAHGKEKFVKMAEPQVGRTTLETLGILPPKKKVEKVKTPRALTDTEKLARYRINIKNGTATEEQKNFVEQKGYDRETGEKVEKAGGIYPPEVEKKRKQATAILKDLDERKEFVSPDETVIAESVQTYLDSTMEKYGGAGFAGKKEIPYQTFEEEKPTEILSPETQAYFKQGGWKTLEDFKASPEYQTLMANGTAEQIDRMEEDAESYFSGGF